jgi:hypothetical protein
MNAITQPQQQAMNSAELPRSNEWIWVARTILALIYMSTGAMRMTIDASQLQRMGDWTTGYVAPHPLGMALMLAAASLLLPRTARFNSMTMAGGFALFVFSTTSFLFHCLEIGSGWPFDISRILLLIVVLRDTWKLWNQHA